MNNKKNTILYFIIFLSALSVMGQQLPKTLSEKGCSPNDFGLKPYRIKYKNGFIDFYLWFKDSSAIKSFALDVSGSTATPIIRYKVKPDNSVSWYRKIPTDLRNFPSDWAYLIVSKQGMPFCTEKDQKIDLSKYDSLNDLSTWVKVNSLVVDYVKKNVLKNTENIVAVGRSEGANVVPQLALQNKKITHIWCWGGGYLSDFYDFATFIRWQVLKGDISQEEGHKKIEALLLRYKNIYSKPNSLEMDGGYTKKRWTSYAEPTLYSLLKLDIPIYLFAGGNDDSSPIESTYAVALEFIRLGKTNLTYKVCPNCDHGMEEKTTDGKIIDHADEFWFDMFKLVK